MDRRDKPTRVCGNSRTFGVGVFVTVDVKVGVAVAVGVGVLVLVGLGVVVGVSVGGPGVALGGWTNQHIYWPELYKHCR
jgi:hypothetical protein